MCVYACINMLLCVHLCIHDVQYAHARVCVCVCVHVPVCLFVLHARSVRPGHRMLQGHVRRSSERQSVCAVVVDQLRDAGEDAATLIQREAQTLNALRLGHDDVHTTLAGLQSDGVLAGS